MLKQRALLWIVWVGMLSHFHALGHTEIPALQLVYEVKGQSSSQLWTGAFKTPREQQSPTRFSQRYQYKVALSYLYRQDGSLILRAEWSSWRVDGAVPNELQAILDQVMRLSPTYVRCDAQGHIGFANPLATEGWKRQAIGSILWPFQFVRSDRAANEWRVRENHYSAPVVCRYRLIKSEKNLKFYNKVIENTILSENEKQIGINHQIIGYLQYCIDSQGILLSVRGTLKERFTLKGIPTSSNEVRIQINLLRKNSIPRQQLAKWAEEAQVTLKQAKFYALYTPLLEEEQARLRAQALLGTTSVQQLLQELDACIQHLPESPQERWRILTPLSLKLEAALVLYPETVLPAFRERLNRIKEPNDIFLMMLGVLCASTREDAQKLLLDQVQHATSREKQLLVARQIAQIKTPHLNLIESILKIINLIQDNEVRKNLQISISILINKIENKYKSIEQFANWVAQNLQYAIEKGTDTEQIHWLTVAGNLGHPATLALTEHLARTGVLHVRLTAIDALRSQDCAKVTLILDKLYSVEPSAQVRQRMVQILADCWHQDVARKLIERAAFSDPDTSVRKACISALSNLASRHTDALDLLVRIAESNSLPTIRREAMVALALLHTQGVKIPPIRSAPQN